MNKLWGGGVPDSVSDRYSLRLCCLLLCTSTLTPLLIYSHLSFYIRSSAYPVIAGILPRISAYCTNSKLPPGRLLSPFQHIDYPLCLSNIPWSLLSDFSFLSPLTPWLPRIIFEGRLKLFIYRLLAPLCLYPATAPFVARLACTYLKYWSQTYPLRHGCLSSPYINHLRLCSWRFLYYFHPECLPFPVR